MKGWLKRFAVAGVVLIALIAAFVLVEHVRGRWMLSRRLSALEARGEVLSVTALQPQRPSSDQNAVLVLLTLTNRLRSVLTNSSAYPTGQAASARRLQPDASAAACPGMALGKSF